MDMDLVQQDDEEDKEDRGGSVVNKRQLADRARVWTGDAPSQIC